MTHSPDCERVRGYLEKKFHNATLTLEEGYRYQGKERGDGWLLLWKNHEYFCRGHNWYKMTPKKEKLVTGNLAEEFNQLVISKFTKTAVQLVRGRGWMAD